MCKENISPRVYIEIYLNVIFAGGLERCEGVFFLQFKSRFDTSAQVAAWIGSLLTAFRQLMGKSFCYIHPQLYPKNHK